MITTATRARLRKLGKTDDEIGVLTPSEASVLLDPTAD